MRLLFRVPFFTLGLINFEYFVSNIVECHSQVSVTKYLIALSLIFKSYIKLSLKCSFQMWNGGLKV